MALKQQCMHLKENEVESSKLVAEKLSRQLGELRAEGFRLREQLEQESAAADFAVRAERTTMSTEMRHQQELFAAAKAEAQRAKEECLRLRGRLADQSSANATEVRPSTFTLSRCPLLFEFALVVVCCFTNTRLMWLGAICHPVRN